MAETVTLVPDERPADRRPLTPAAALAVASEAHDDAVRALADALDRFGVWTPGDAAEALDAELPRMPKVGVAAARFAELARSQAALWTRLAEVSGTTTAGPSAVGLAVSRLAARMAEHTAATEAFLDSVLE